VLSGNGTRALIRLTRIMANIPDIKTSITVIDGSRRNGLLQ